MQAVNAFVNSLSQGNEAWKQLSSQLSIAWLVLAQYIQDPDILGQMRDAWNYFVSSGQVWALLIGFFVGYLFRNLTSY
ncbi:MAG: hypothetical protein F6K58_03095 [Symploca sp. SIO2E9]|nr:hypothetical protein [Symploca sp. SIO2E9]